MCIRDRQMTPKAEYKNGVMVPENGPDNETLYPRHAECPACWFNLVRYKMRTGLDPRAFVRECPECGNELVGW